MYKKNQYNLGERIQFFRKKIGMTQKELADILNIKVNRLSGWEKGASRPAADYIGLLCQALNVSPSELLDVRLTEEEYTYQEREVIRAYRDKKELQHAVNVLLGLEDES